MQREIKFRAQRSTESGTRGEWQYGYFVQTHERPNRTESWIVGDAHGKTVLVYPDSVGQFTGLHDKNGKEIYEGDILGAESVVGTYEVFWSGHKAAWDAKGGTGYLPAWLNSFTLGLEVIGNIYVSPELLAAQ